MLSQTEFEYIKGLTLNWWTNDYDNYLCITNNPNSSYNQSYYDIFCYYSKDKITKSGNTYTIPLNSYRCSIDTKNPTSTNKQDTLNCESFGGNVTVNTKEFIYSSVEYESDFIRYQILSNFYRSTGLTIIVMIFVWLWIWKLFNLRSDTIE